MPATPRVSEPWSAWRTISGWELGILPGEGGMSADGKTTENSGQTLGGQLWHNPKKRLCVVCSWSLWKKG